MSLQNLFIGLVAFVALGLGFVNYQQPESTLSAVVGPEVLDRFVFRDGIVVGGTNTATSSAGAATYSAAQVFTSQTITHTAASALTATFPASSTVSFIPRTGDTKTLFILPVTTGITFAGGTGLDLNTASSTKFCVAGSVCRFDFVRKSNTDIEVLMTPASGL